MFYPKKLLFLIVALCSFSAKADENKYHNYLTGDWHGNRTKLSDLGLDFTFTSQNNFDNNFSGGVKKGHGLLNINNIKLNIDAEKLFGLGGTTAQISFIKTFGVKPNQKWVGTLAQVDNFEAVASLAKIQEAWVAKQVGKHNILVGYYNLADDFFTINSANLFIASNFTTGVELAQSSVNGNLTYYPSVFPSMTLGSRIKLQFNDYFYLQTAISDLVAQRSPSINHINDRVNNKNGQLSITQIGSNSNYGNYFFGYWTSTKKNFNEIQDSSKKNNNNGFYFGLEKNLVTIDEQKISAFYRFGTANKKVMPISCTMSSGLVINNIFKSRDSSQIGFGYNQVRLGSNYLNILAENNQKTKKIEHSFELTYKENLLPWLQIQPDLQYIIKPALYPVDISANYPKNALVGILSFTLNF